MISPFRSLAIIASSLRRLIELYEADLRSRDVSIPSKQYRGQWKDKRTFSTLHYSEEEEIAEVLRNQGAVRTVDPDEMAEIAKELGR